ncbi:MAG TPA: DUF2125 domain-containing protein [Rhizomicrobium sp.]|nr:DUF2125 domain-containing protein [Rhizomicrobium sp.]
MRLLNYSSRFWLYAPLVLFLALAAWAMGHWWSVAGALDSKLKAMNGHQAIPGVTISWRKQTISGFPFNLDVVLDNLQMQAEAPRGPLIWHSDQFALHTLSYGGAHYIFEAAGPQILAWSDADNERHQLSFLPAGLHASSIADGKGLARFDLDMVGASGKDSDGGAFTVARVQFHMRRDPKGDALDLMQSAVDVRGPATPFGDRIQSLEVYSQVTQGSAFFRLLAGRAGWMDALMAWRHQNGAIAYGPVRVQSSAVKADKMDAALEPRLRALLFPFY